MNFRFTGSWLPILVVAGYGVFLFATNPLVTVFDDEASIIAGARKPASEVVAAFAKGYGLHQHPPLSDLLLHYWLRLTGESLLLLRLPSIVFYCLALWVTARTAEWLWQRGWMALVLGIAWPAGYFLGRPAGWYSLAMLGLAALAWFYLRRNWTGFILAALLLAYTSYFAWVFLAVLAADFLAQRPTRAELMRFAGALGTVVLLALPAIRVLLSEAREGVALPRTFAQLANSLYLAHSLLAGEMTAPWTWAGATALAAAGGLLCLSRIPAARRFGLWVAVPLTIAAATGVLNGKRLALFGPGLILFLTALTTGARKALTLALVTVAFGMGWLGIITGRFPGTLRYSEPWSRVVQEVLALSRPGDAILANHPSFYFYLSHPAGGGLPEGRAIGSVSEWRELAGSGALRLVYVRAVLTAGNVPFDRALLEYGSRLQLEDERRYLRDPGFELKRKLFPKLFQPEWRIQVLVWRLR